MHCAIFPTTNQVRDLKKKGIIQQMMAQSQR